MVTQHHMAPRPGTPSPGALSYAESFWNFLYVRDREFFPGAQTALGIHCPATAFEHRDVLQHKRFGVNERAC